MKKILLTSNSIEHFYAHLLPIAVEAKNRGYEVVLLTSGKKFQQDIEMLGIKVITIAINRKSVNPFREIGTLASFIKIINKENPDIIHNFTIKPIFYANLVAILYSGKYRIINNFLGMGYIFVSNNLMAFTIREMISNILRLAARFRKVINIVQNRDDQILLESLMPNIKTYTQCSVGVDIEQVKPTKSPTGKVVFALVARMLKDKGVYEFIEAAKILRKENLKAEFWLVGDIDKGNRASLSELEMEKIGKEGVVKYLGYQQIENIWPKAHVAVLPSYREGLSRSLLEAAIYERAIITADAPGGRELIQHDVDGMLVKPRDTSSLAAAMQELCLNEAKRKKLAAQIRQKVLTQYSDKIIAAKMVDFY